MIYFSQSRKGALIDVVVLYTLLDGRHTGASRNILSKHRPFWQRPFELGFQRKSRAECIKGINLMNCEFSYCFCDMFNILALCSLFAAVTTVLALPTAQDVLQSLMQIAFKAPDSQIQFEFEFNNTMVDAWTSEVVNVHNNYRAQYRAPAVTWSNDLYAGTLAWARQCQFRHRLEISVPR